MADQIEPQGVVGSPIRRSEPRPAAPPGEPGRQGPPHGALHDGVPELIDPGVTADRQSRRYAHTMRRSGELSAPIRVSDTASAPIRVSDTASAPVRASDPATPPARASDPGGSTAEHHDTNRTSAPSDSTALYRKRTNPALPTVSPEMIARAQPVSDSPEDDAAIDAAIDATMDRGPSARPEDMPSDLPSVMLDAPRSTGIVMRPLALPRLPARLLLSIIAAALVVLALWMFLLAF